MDISIQAYNRKLCRTCLRQYDSRKDLVSLFEFESFTSPKIRLIDMLSNIYNETLPENDTLPSKICIMCISSLRVSYFFRQEVEKSQIILMKRINSSGLSVNIKQEPNEESFPVILGSKHVAVDAFNSSNIQMDSDNEIIDYEPDIDSVCATYTDTSMSSSTNANETNETGTDGKFACDVCNRDFSSFKALHCHKRSAHAATKCRYCQKKFGNMQQLTLHTKFKHADNYNEFKLSINDSTTSVSSESSSQHEKIDGSVVILERLEKYNECSTCGVIFVNKIALVKHHADCDSKCPDCGLKIPRRDFYFKHLETIHKYSSIDLSGYECPFCMNLFRTEKILQEHIQSFHPDENQSNADTFSEADESVSNDNEGFNVHQCKICKLKFLSAKSLKQHTTVKHREEGQLSSEKITSNVPKYTKDEFFEKFIVKKSNDFYRCIPCQKDIFKRSMASHIRNKHTCVRSFRCELCSDAFLRSDYRQRHVAAAHPNDFKCNECSVQFDRSYKYEAHMTKHGKVQKKFKPAEGEDPYELALSQIKYIEDSSNYDYSNDLQNLLGGDISSVPTTNVELPLTKDEFFEKHMSTISDRYIKCNFCNVEMKNSSVISHMLWKHSVNKPLKCSFCNDRVVKNNARLAHMARCHPDEYKCIECNQQFAKHLLYSDHMLEVHRVKITSKPSSGEEDDLLMTEMRFICYKNDDEVIEETYNNINIEIQKNQSVEKSYGCQHCPKKFTSSKNLLIHKSHKHKNDTQSEFQEPPTDSSINEPISFEEFKENWVEFINSSDVKCLVCEVVMKIKNFAAHIKQKHSISGPFLCALCPENFHRPDHRIQHMLQNHRGIFYCKTCSIQFHRNSRYAKHMHDSHGIEIDSYDSYEVDLGLSDLKFVPFVRKASDDDLISHASSINDVDTEMLDPMEEMMQMISTNEEMSRTDFMKRYIKPAGNDTKGMFRHCLACDNVFNQSSIYHHLVHFHSTVLPFKCPFCDVRFERTVQRSRHLQLFHPEEYKCNECGLQFQKHVKYSDHMLMEHNTTQIAPKSPHEEEDISSIDLKYTAQKSLLEDTFWQDDENSVVNSTAYSEGHDDSSNIQQEVLNIKSDEPEKQTISFMDDNRLVEIPQQSNSSLQMFEEEMPYLDFKAKYYKKLNENSLKCLACNRIILKSATCAHMRLWHATCMIYNCELCPAGFRRQDYRMRHMALQHPDDYKCNECGNQFHYSMAYQDHLLTEHQISKRIPRIKGKDEVDIPLDRLKFTPFIPEEMRTHDTHAVTTQKRRLSVCADRPAKAKLQQVGNNNATGEGYTYKEFYNKYVEPKGDSATCKVCKAEFSKLAIKKHIKREHSTRRQFYCQLCDKGFLRIDDRMTHMRKDHPDSFKCLICDIQFYMSTVYIDHMSKEHNMTLKIAVDKTEDDIDIPFENMRFLPNINSTNKSSDTNNGDNGYSRDEFSARFFKRTRINGELILHCTVCNKPFSPKQKRFHLLQQHAKDKPFGCDLCPSRFMSNFKRVKHVESQHPGEFKCEICVFQFEKAESYSKHMEQEHKMSIKVTPNGNEDIDCDSMRYYEVTSRTNRNETADNNAANLDENSSSNNIESLHCEICNVDFDSSRSFRQHMRDHGGDNGTELRPLSPMKKPIETIKIEKVEKLFECEICNKKMSSVLARNAHKKFKHGIYNEGGVKQKAAKQKFEVVCEICEFTSFRRDYLEHHMKAQHKSEYSCGHCRRILSSYNYFLYHIQTNHYTKPDVSKFFKCPDCNCHFKLEENLKKHRETKHENPPKRKNFCELCTMDFKYPTQLNVHLETYTHKNLASFFNGESSGEVKNEPKEKLPAIDETQKTANGSAEYVEPRPKRIKLSTDDSTAEKDKLDYLNFIQTTESGHFKCAICGKVKSLRKYMLHHLKQHKEVPTHNCNRCPERFVFKSKYDKHMEWHEKGSSASSLVLEKDPIIENEHPKFQAVKPTEIRCSICNLTFKLTIILNKHNATWHSEENPMRNLTMDEQKAKKIESQAENCNKEQNNVDAGKTEENSNKLSCERCSLKFHDKKYLENHQNFFCAYRFQGPINEQ